MHCIIYSTVGSPGEAKKIARILVEENLAACVNYWKINSVYRWQNSIHEDDETALFVKTRTECSDKVIKRIKELHSYELPEIIIIEIKGGSEEYLSWVDRETKN